MRKDIIRDPPTNMIFRKHATFQRGKSVRLQDQRLLSTEKVNALDLLRGRRDSVPTPVPKT
jgi:hypothetical protein